MKISDDFLLNKKKQLSRKDSSNIGEWHEKIKALCEKINNKENYYTTSSCSGRIVLLKSSDKKIENAFLFRSHEKLVFKDFKKVLKKIDYNGIVEFQQTPCILHVACRTIEDAFEIVRLAKLAGWKRSGIMSVDKKNRRVMVELHSTESMSFPIMNKKNLLVSEDCIKIVICIANSKLERVWKKIKKLESFL